MAKKKNPKISVIIPAHNEEEVIGRTLDSVLANKYGDMEIIVSNDGSTDKTREIVEGYIKKDKRIKVINQDKGHSAAFARNRGAEVAKGEIFVFLDADTIINNIFVEEIAKKYGGADAFISLNYPLTENIISKILSAFIGKSIKEKLKDGNIYNKKNKQDGGIMFFCITKKAYNKISGYDERIFYYEDEKFAQEFYKKGFKSIFVKRANQYYELPSTFSEFIRQCEWLGKGTNTIQDKKIKNKHKLIWFTKSIFLISPIFFIWNFSYFLYIFLLTILISYISLVNRNGKPLLSFLALPFLYIKTFLVSINILIFWK